MKKECGSMSEKSRKAVKRMEEEGFDVCSATDCTGLIPAGSGFGGRTGTV